MFNYGELNQASFRHLATTPQFRLLTRWTRSAEAELPLKRDVMGPAWALCFAALCSGPSSSCAPPGQLETTGGTGMCLPEVVSPSHACCSYPRPWTSQAEQWVPLGPRVTKRGAVCRR